MQSLCRDNDDEMRWLIALISDTGMRLGEAAGLLKEDIKVNEPIPCEIGFVLLNVHQISLMQLEDGQQLE